MILKISGPGAELRDSSAARRLPGRRRPASCGAPSSLRTMVDAASREQVVRYLNFRFALVGEVTLEAPSAEMAPRERGVARLISST